MKRRKFFETAGLTLAGAVIAPQLLAEDELIALPSRLHIYDDPGFVGKDNTCYAVKPLSGQFTYTQNYKININKELLNLKGVKGFKEIVEVSDIIIKDVFIESLVFQCPELEFTIVHEGITYTFTGLALYYKYVENRKMVNEVGFKNVKYIRSLSSYNFDNTINESKGNKVKT